MGQSVLFRSFAAGELAPGLYARADLSKYATALRTCRNFLVRRHGGASNRPGTKFIIATKNSSSAQSFLRPFIIQAETQSFIVECGDNYFRFFQNGARIEVTNGGVTAWSNATAYVPGDLALQGGVVYYCILAHTNQVPPNATYWYALPAAPTAGKSIYEIPTPYSSGAFKAPSTMGWSQQGLTVTLTHVNYAPAELTYSSSTRWVLTTLTTGPSQSPPTAPGGVAGGAGTKTFKYVITAAKAESYEESNVSAVVTIATAADPTPAAPHVISWTAPAGTAPPEYYVYSDGGFGNGTFGYLGTATGQVSFNDVGEDPDFSLTPPVGRTLFNAVNTYPGVSVTHQQRRWFATSNNEPERVDGSRTGFRSNFNITSPLQDDDAIRFYLVSQRLQVTRHMLSLKFGLVLMTDAAEWVISGDQDGVIRPNAINLDAHSWVGCTYTAPIILGNVVIFVQARGSIVRDMVFEQQVEGYGGRDLTIYSSHLFRGYSIGEMAHQQVPDSIVWMTRSDGTLLGLTYIREEDVWGWHRHDTDGYFESVCVVPEGLEDAVYVVVKRTVNGSTVRYVERMASRDVTVAADAFFVDAGVTVTNGSPATAVSGLSHLNGKSVVALVDGQVQGPFTVTAGAITLTTAGTKVQVGLPITAQLETLDLDVGGSDVRDKKKRVARVSLLLEASYRGFSVGPTSAALKAFVAKSYELNDVPFTGKVEQAVPSSWNDYGRVFIQHTDPTPLTVLGVIPHVEVGG